VRLKSALMNSKAQLNANATGLRSQSNGLSRSRDALKECRAPESGGERKLHLLTVGARGVHERFDSRPLKSLPLPRSRATLAPAPALLAPPPRLRLVPPPLLLLPLLGGAHDGP